MKRLALLLLLTFPLAGCPSASTTPPAALAPGYLNQFDQTAGQTLAAAHALVLKATQDYPTLSPAMQTREKPSLNAFVTAVNTADSVYLAYHNGTATQAQVQAQLTTVNSAQTNFTSSAVQ